MNETIRTLATLALVAFMLLPILPATGAECSRAGEGSSGLSLVSWTIEGKIEGQYQQISNQREIYNQGEGQAAVSELFALPGNTTHISLQVTSGLNVFTLSQTDRPLSVAELKASSNTVFYQTMDQAETRDHIDELVTRHSEPALLALGNGRLLVMEFALEPRSFATIEIEYTRPVLNSAGLNSPELSLMPSMTIDGDHGPMRADESGTVDIGIGSLFNLEGLYSPTHDITVVREGLKNASVIWTGSAHVGETMSLHYSELTDAFGAGLLNYRLDGKTMFQEDEDGYFMFLFTPNTEEFADQALPKDIVFVIDTSGSMDGDKLTHARKALKGILDILNPNDRFTIVSFSQDTERYTEGLNLADSEGVSSAKAYVDSLSAGGSTNINAAVLEALDILDMEQEAGRPGEIFFLTDGEATTGVTNSGSILSNVQDRNQVQEVGATIYVFGIGTAINTFLLDSLASNNDGSTDYITEDRDIDEVLTTFYDTIAAPVLTDITLEVDGVEVLSRFPGDIPDLYRGGELNLVGMYAFLELDTEGNPSPTDEVPDEIIFYINGTTTTGDVSYIHSFDMSEPGQHTYLPRIFATRAVGELLQQNKQAGETEERIELIEHYGRRYGIETPYTTLALEPDPIFDSDGFRKLTGEASVEASLLIHSYSRSRFAGAGLADNARLVGDRTFVNLDNIHVESTLLPDTQVIELEGQALEEWLNDRIDVDRFVRFASVDYFTLAEDPKVRDILAMGTEVIFTDQNEVIGVTKGNLLLFIRELEARRWGDNLSVTWETSEPATSNLYYRLVTTESAREWQMARDPSLNLAHNITLDLPLGVYDFYVVSSDPQGNIALKDDGGSYFSFYNLPVVITQVRANIGYAGFFGEPVTIRWYTNLPAKGALYIKVGANGVWQHMGSTDRDMVHEVTFTIPYDPVYDYDIDVTFYVTAQVDEYLLEGEPYQLTFVLSGSAMPSYQASLILIVMSVLAVAVLIMTTRIESKKR